MSDKFEERGFLSDEIKNYIPSSRAENRTWFKLCEDVNIALMLTANIAMGRVNTRSMTPQAVAVRVLLRSCGTLQGIILLSERGMVTEGRTLTRSLLENAFCIAALLDEPSAFMEMLRKDAEASRRQQAKFIIAEKLVGRRPDLDNLQAQLDRIGQGDLMSPKKVAALGALMKQYLAYQRLSDDAAHPSAKSLNRHVQTNSNRSGWVYKWGPGDLSENAATLHYAILAALPVGIGITQQLKLANENLMFRNLADRFQGMPAVAYV